MSSALDELSHRVGLAQDEVGGTELIQIGIWGNVLDYETFCS